LCIRKLWRVFSFFPSWWCFKTDQITTEISSLIAKFLVFISTCQFYLWGHLNFL
jgi:hypothetical protein